MLVDIARGARRADCPTMSRVAGVQLSCPPNAKVSPFLTVPSKRGKGHTMRYASFTLTLILGTPIIV